MEQPSHRFHLTDGAKVVIQGNGIEEMEYIDASEFDMADEKTGPTHNWSNTARVDGFVQKPDKEKCYKLIRAMDEKAVLVEASDVTQIEDLEALGARSSLESDD